ncbi:glutathione peroxidase [bacterium]|jgi:glutathione peroxidase|nr:glutathione peroxidase [bacterium]
MSIFDLSVVQADGKTRSLSEYRGKVLLIVNTASRCGFTPQYEGLEELYRRYRDQGLEILAFPCNQFGKQEPGTDTEIQEFCRLEYSTSFPVFSKIEVNGAGAHPLYVWLKGKAPGILGSEAIKWNFTKFLVSRDGNSVRRFAPQDRPESLGGEIETMINGID